MIESSASSNFIADGNLDIQKDLRHLSRKEKWSLTQLYLVHVDSHARLLTAANLQLRFNLRFLEFPQRASVKEVNAWKRDGMISVATIACNRCIEVNSARPIGQGCPPFSCLVRSRPDKNSLRADGSQMCACCSATSRTSCRAWGGTHPHKTLQVETKGGGKTATTTTTTTKKGVRRMKKKLDSSILDAGSDLSSLDSDACSSEESSSDVPLAEIAKQRNRIQSREFSETPFSQWTSMQATRTQSEQAGYQSKRHIGDPSEELLIEGASQASSFEATGVLNQSTGNDEVPSNPVEVVKRALTAVHQSTNRPTTISLP